MEETKSTTVRFAVLGPVRAWHGEGELDLGSPQQRAVLATLLMRRRRPVTVGELVDAVWGDHPPVAAVPVLRTYVSRLRKLLESGRDTDEPPRVLVSSADGYLARVPEDALDLGLFEQQVARARQLKADGEVSAATDLLHTALAGWEGMPLAGLPGPLAEAERSRLNEEWLNTMETRLELDIQLGRHHNVIPELTSLTGDHPLREELSRLLMLALYRAGRQAEALAAYRGAWNTLVTELGIEPGTALRQLHDRILAADASLDLPPPPQQVHGEPRHEPPKQPATEVDTQMYTASPPAVNTVGPAQLPADLPTFTGRHSELEQIRGLLHADGSLPDTVVISAISGMAGIGKTTLAVHWAHEIADRFPDGQLAINLRGFDPTGTIVPPEEAIRIFLDALGVPAQRIPSGLDAQQALYRSMLANRRVLILLDNAREVEQVRPLLPGSPGCMVIVTSRNQLTGLIVGDGGYPLTLNQLTPAESRDFIEHRFGARRAVAEPQAIEEIVERCARLPLALAIVAARAATHPAFPLSAIADELRDSYGNLDVFAGDDLSTDVRAVFSWSYETLSAPAARLFHLLGLHTGHDMSAPAAAALAGLTLRQTRGLLVELAHANLLTEQLPGRYTVHDLLRQYAAERVLTEETAEERDLAVERLLSWYLYTADATYPLLTPKRRRVPLGPVPASCQPLTFTTLDQALDWCAAERANLVAAVHQAGASARSDIAWKLTCALWGFFYLRSHSRDWLATASTGLRAARAADDRWGEAWSLGSLAAAERTIGQLDAAIGHLHAEGALWRKLGDAQGRTSAVGNLGDAYVQKGQPDKALVYLRRSLALDRLIGHTWGRGIGLANLGDAYQRLGRFDEAIECLEEAMTVLRGSGNRWVEGVALDILGTAQFRLGRHREAVETYRQALEAHREVRNRWGMGHSLGNLGDVHVASGAPGEARANWRQALEILSAFDHPDAERIRERLRRLEEDPPPGA